MGTSTPSARISSIQVGRLRGVSTRDAGERRRGAFFHEVADIDDDLLRREELAGEVGRASLGAAAAFGAGVRVKELLPGEILELARAEGLACLHALLHVDDRGEDAGRLEAAGEDLRGDREDVRVLRVGEVAEEDEEVEQVLVKEDGVERFRRAL